MRINRVECEQFAGLTDKKLVFEKGLNLVVGENESGKSTIVDLIFQLLFQDVKLDGRSDSGFIDKYFPKRANGPQGDVIDGTLVLETPKGTYKLKKEWDRDGGTCRLTLPDGTSLKGKDAINEILTGELKYRAGVYDEIVFASQKRKQSAVESIMKALGKKNDPLNDTRTNLTSTLSQAALETGGVSLDKISSMIDKNISDLIGRWDVESDAPEGGAKRASYKHKWSNGAGAIVRAYYEVDEIRSMQTEAENAELAIESEKAAIQVLQGKKKEVESERETFQQFRGLIGQISLLEDAIADCSAKLEEQNKALEDWPGLTGRIAKARELKGKLEMAQVHERFLEAEPVYRSLGEKQSELKELQKVEDADLKDLKNNLFKRDKEESKLAGMNLVAKVEKLGSAEIIVTAVSSGETLDLAGGEVQVKEAVNIHIPGIMDMNLMPKGVDVELVKKNLQELDTEINKVYEKYAVASPEELEKKSAAYSDAEKEAERLRTVLERILGDEDWEALKVANDKVPEGIETEEEIQEQIDELCKGRSVDAFVGGLESRLFGYESKYKSIEDLKKGIEEQEEKKKGNRKKLDEMEKIPEEYQGIEDAEGYDEGLKEAIRDYEDQINIRREKLNEAERKLGEKSSDEYADELQSKEEIFAACKAEYEHWNHIRNVFNKLKEQTAGNPVEDIEEKFREYLCVITSDHLHLNSMDEQLSVQMESGSNALTYDTLSDGTKDTISLAFRLAMLEHLYPEGDGLAVFDDPFTDMDAKRVEESCKLIQKFAGKNQVIFVTCDHKYQDLLSGNVILVNR